MNATASRWAVYVGMAVVAFLVAGWALNADVPPPPPPSTEVAIPVPVPVAQAPAAAPRRAEPPPAEPQPVTAPEPVVDLGEARRAGIPERRAEVEAKLEEIADARGWDGETRAAVSAVVLDTLDEAERKLADVHDPDTWRKMRVFYGRHRQIKARSLKSVLSDEELEAFMKAKAFPRIPSTTGQQGIRWWPVRVREND